MEATIRREKLIIPTYGQGAAEELPLFSDLRINQGTRGYIYPYRMSDKLTMVKEDKAYDAIRLENDFIRQFFRFLQEDAGVEIEIHTNNWGYPNETM